MQPLSEIVQEKIGTKEPSEDQRYCDRHKVPMKFFDNGNKELRLKKSWWCLECTKEHEAKEQQERFLQQKKQQQETLNRNITNAMIAERFKSKTFENYIDDGVRQKFVLAKCKGFLNHMDQSVGLIFIGNKGTGKNHLASAIVKEAIAKHQKTALFTTAIKVIRRIKKTWSTHEDEEKIIQSFVTPDLLVIDEIGVQFGSATETLYLTEIINDRYNWMKPTILIGNVTMDEMEKIVGDRAIDRFRESGQVLIFDWNSFRGKKQEVDRGIH